jgi:hypothetical protein
MQAIGNFDTTIAAAAEVDLIVGSRASEGAAGIVISIAVCSWACGFEQLGVSGWRTLGGRTIRSSEDHQKIPENSTHRIEIGRYITLWPSHDASARSH